MPIAALPQATVRAIGSTSVISDPCSVVKELLDNALDASATSVSIEVSTNTIDVIQVKDNGHGIPSTDHAFVCKRSFTSKIQTVDDLRCLGGKFLGFRGEALASAAEISGSVAVSTRTEAEPVGSSLKYGRNGELLSSQRASHPVGTTVRITDLFKHIPVRKQTALKNATKALAAIRKLLQSYAAAQPSKRLSLKVVKAKNENLNWIYAPAKSATIKDAAIKIVGTDVASSCILIHWPSSEDVDSLQPRVDNTPGFKFEVLLLDPAADYAKIKGVGQFLAIDDRPISCSRGIGRDISKLYKSYLRSTLSRANASQTIPDPFLCLHVRCIGTTYDVNIEPAKDDILFEDAQKLVSLVEALFRDTYGEKKGSRERQLNQQSQKSPAADSKGFNVFLARKNQSERTLAPVDDSREPHTTKSVAARSLVQSAEGLTESHRQQAQDLNACQTIGEATNKKSPETWSTTNHNVPSRGRNQPKQRSPKASSRLLPSPSTSEISTASSPGTEFSRTAQTSPTTRFNNEAARAARDRARERYGNGALDTWFKKTTQGALARIAAEHGVEDDRDEPTLSRLAHERFHPQDQHPIDPSASWESPSSATPGILGSSRPEQNLNPASTSQRTESEKRQEFPVLEQWASRLQSISGSSQNANLEDALDFEIRKKEAIHKRREQMKASTNSPHMNRYLAARAALQTDSNGTGGQNLIISKETIYRSRLNPHDPRSYLIRCHNTREQETSSQDDKFRRINTVKLPLEKIPEGSEMHDVCLKAPVTLPIVSKLHEHLVKNDLYTQCGNQYDAFSKYDSQPDLVSLWKARLSVLAQRNYRTNDGTNISTPQFDFTELSQRLNDSQA
ncbi:hypothetical protein BDV25DRAFT_172706 [Aspergillus avenaceus]|uniref:DNA mismatch repair protein S5 domain-containing protein n=1 Tax=Aspergillus avenaceus TaxID=36643 RepID=A0A5N6TTL1_ASPAV|nr:hypothetical protein BDV25DRAFT_172706 [Aspergillus avenaceus]